MLGRCGTPVDCDSFRECLRCHVIFWERSDETGLALGAIGILLDPLAECFGQHGPTAAAERVNDFETVLLGT
jgi:hypothetical protein